MFCLRIVKNEIEVSHYHTNNLIVNMYSLKKRTFLCFVLVPVRNCLFEMLIEHSVRSKGLEIPNKSELIIEIYLVTGLTLVLINALMFVDVPIVADFQSKSFGTKLTLVLFFFMSFEMLGARLVNFL